MTFSPSKSCYNNFNSPMQGKAQASFIRDLYLKKFYTGNSTNTHSLLSKVISFQKKLQDSRINRNYSQRIEETPFLLQEEANRFRPNTNCTLSRKKQQRYAGQHSSRGIDGPATAELKLILDRNNADMNILTESIRERNLYSKNQTRKKWKLISNRETLNSHQLTENATGKLTPIDMGHFYQDKDGMRSVRGKRTLILKQQLPRENEGESVRSGKTVSKRVFIGGRDLSKAAEEEYQNYLQLKNNLQQLVHQQKKKDEESAKSIIRKGLQKKRIRRISPKKAENTHNYNAKGSKTQPKNKQEDLSLNYQLDPWSVEPETS